MNFDIASFCIGMATSATVIGLVYFYMTFRYGLVIP